MPGPSRRERAQQTRLRVLTAAQELFVERGYTGTRMQDVADAAGVAVQTVYYVFRSKPELLQACYERAVLGDEGLPPPAQSWYRELMAAPSGSDALRHFAGGNTDIVSRVGVLDDVTRSALHEPEAVAVRSHSEALRRDGYAGIVAYLASAFGLRGGLTEPAAVDLLLAFGGASLYRSLVVDYGWPPDRYVEWLAAVLAEQLLAGAAPQVNSEASVASARAPVG